MDLKMHVYSVPLRYPFVFPYVLWNFEVGERLWPEIRGGGTAFPHVLFHFNHWALLVLRLSSRLIRSQDICSQSALHASDTLTRSFTRYKFVT